MGLDEEMKQETILVDLINNLKPEPHSITQLADKVKMNRSTLRYYLSLLLQRNWVTVKREKEMSGRPVMISVNTKQFEKEQEDYEKKVEEIKAKHENSPYMKKILKALSSKKRMSMKEILEETKPIDPHGIYISNTKSHLRFAIDVFGLVNEFYEISDEGRKKSRRTK